MSYFTKNAMSTTLLASWLLNRIVYILCFMYNVQCTYKNWLGWLRSLDLLRHWCRYSRVHISIFLQVCQTSDYNMKYQACAVSPLPDFPHLLLKWPGWASFPCSLRAGKSKVWEKLKAVSHKNIINQKNSWGVRDFWFDTNTMPPHMILLVAKATTGKVVNELSF